MNTFFAEYYRKSFPVYQAYENYEDDPAYLFVTAFSMTNASHFTLFYPSTLNANGTCHMSVVHTVETESLTDIVTEL